MTLILQICKTVFHVLVTAISQMVPQNQYHWITTSWLFFDVIPRLIFYGCFAKTKKKTTKKSLFSFFHCIYQFFYSIQKSITFIEAWIHTFLVCISAGVGELSIYSHLESPLYFMYLILWKKAPPVSSLMNNFYCLLAFNFKFSFVLTENTWLWLKN